MYLGIRGVLENPGKWGCFRQSPHRQSPQDGREAGEGGKDRAEWKGRPKLGDTVRVRGLREVFNREIM